MNKETILENAQLFVDEYENIKDKLEMLFDDTTNKDLKNEINELISVLEEDFYSEYSEQLSTINMIEEEEENALYNEYRRSQL